ncbi:hypothetical protein Dimus_013566, partial [Dionaea muscipula]
GSSIWLLFSSIWFALLIDLVAVLKGLVNFVDLVVKLLVDFVDWVALLVMLAVLAIEVNFTEREFAEDGRLRCGGGSHCGGCGGLAVLDVVVGSPCSLCS